MDDHNRACWQRLRRLKDPRSHRDIVAQGDVTAVHVDDGRVTVTLADRPGDRHHMEALEAAIRRTLSGTEGVRSVQLRLITDERRGGKPGPDGPRSSLRLPVLEEPDDGSAPYPAGLAPESGYGLGGPAPLPSPEIEGADERYEGWPPVFQWEIVPGDPGLPAGEAQLALGDWEFDIWWQEHPAALTYASIQALRHDPAHGDRQREHPMGRNVVVNLVYDRRRRAVVAVYGTAADFRPFIEAFRIGLDLEQPTEETRP